jgi:hypothetical protein
MKLRELFVQISSFRYNRRCALALMGIFLVFPLRSACAQVPARQSVTSLSPRPEQALPAASKSPLEDEKLKLEIAKLRSDVANDERNPFTLRGLVNLVYGNGALLLGIAAGLWAFYRYLSEQHRLRMEREEVRFSETVQRLGSDSEQQRMGAAVLLPSFLRPGYDRFYNQVFNLASGNLRLQENEEGSANLTPFRQALGNVFRESFARARSLLPASTDSDLPSPDIETELNSSYVNLREAYLVGADLRECWLYKARLDGAIVRAAHLRRANLEGAILTECDLEDADLSSANLLNAVFDNADLHHAVLKEARADGADFRGANLRDSDLRNMTAGGAKFLGADLSGADLTSTTFESVDGNVGTDIELAASLKDTRLFGVIGLTVEQRSICRIKGALLPPEETSSASPFDPMPEENSPFEIGT